MTLETGVKALAEAVAVDVKALDDGKVDKVTGKGLSESDYTTAEKNKLVGVAVEATKNRADSENADKVHTHTVDQVSGLGYAATAPTVGDGTEVLRAGAGGWLGRAGVNSYISGYPQNVDQNISQVYRREGVDGVIPIHSYAASIHIAAIDTWGRIRFHYNTPRVWVQGGTASVGTGWTAELLHTSNILQTTGTSTEFPMSQKAVTDAINVGAGLGIGQTWQNVKASRLKNTTYTNTTGKPIAVFVSFNGTSIVKAELYLDNSAAGESISDGIPPLFTVVPAGGTYRVVSANGYINYWSELR